MSKYVINKTMCNKPVVDVDTGKVIANSFIPYCNKDTLSLDYLALDIHNDGGEDMYLPASAILFINDICTLVKIPETPFIPEEGKSEKILETTISAKIGQKTLFNFGTIGEIYIEKDGNAASISLNDGHSFMVPQDDSHENMAINEAFAAELFNMLNEAKRVTPAKVEEKEEKKEDLPEIKPDVFEEEKPEEKEKEKKKKSKEKNKEKEPEPEQKKETSETPLEDDNSQDNYKRGSRTGILFRLKQCVAPIIALVLFYIAYYAVTSYLFS